MRSKFTLKGSSDMPLSIHFNPVRLFEFTNSYSLIRAEGEEKTFLVGDRLPLPPILELEATISFPDLAERDAFIRALEKHLAVTTDLLYDGQVRIPVIKSWLTVEVDTSRPVTANLNITLIPAKADYDVFITLDGGIYLGATDIFWGDTSITFGDVFYAS